MPNRHPPIHNNTTHLVRSIISSIFRIPGIPSDELHKTSLSHKHYRSALFKNTSQTKSFHLSPQDTATSPAAVSRNDTRLPGNLDPPTVAHNTLNTYSRPLWPITNRQHCPIVTPPPSTNVLKTRSDQTIPLTKTNGNTPHKEANLRKS